MTLFDLPKLNDFDSIALKPIEGDFKLKDAMNETRKQYIMRALNQHDWNQGVAADALGVSSRQALHKLMQSLDIEIPQVRKYRKNV